MAQPINNIQVSGVTYRSTVNGPGIRTVLHTQGCTIGCPGCFNKHTWDLSGGTSVDTYLLAANILSGSDSSNGLTLSGGEPMQQITALRLLVKTIRSWRPETNVLMFSGWNKKTLDLVEGLNNLSQHIDAIIAGPYDKGQKSSGLVASDNQELIIESLSNG